jgi:hypothetical protein
LVLGTDLTGSVTNAYGSSSALDPTDLSLLTNRQVIAVDQDAVDAARIFDVANAQVFAKTERQGDGVVGLFDTKTNLNAANEMITTTASAIGLAADSAGYQVENLWTGQRSTIGSTGAISASAPSEGVALLRVTPLTPGS